MCRSPTVKDTEPQGAAEGQFSPMTSGDSDSGGCGHQEWDCGGDLSCVARAQPGTLGQDTEGWMQCCDELISLSLGAQTTRRQRAAMSLRIICWETWRQMRMTCT